MANLPISDEDRLRTVLERSRSLGFLGPQSIDIQFAHSAAFSDSLQELQITQRNSESGEELATRVLDLGSGGGLPGLVVQSMYPDSSVLLLDSMEKRVTFLESAITELEIQDRVTARCERAEHAARDANLRNSFDIVVARSFGKPSLTAECARGFLRDDGLLIVSEPPEDHSDRWQESGLTALGYEDLGRSSHEYHFRGESGIAHVRRLRAVGEPNERYPRTPTALKKRPLW